MTITRKSLVKKAAGLGVLFHVCVTAPTLLATLYFGLFASNVYISESRFIVRSPSKPEASGMGVLLKTVGFSSGSGDEVFAANDYLASRDAMRELNRNEAVERAYGPGHASWIDRFDPLGYDHSFESLYRYFGKKVSVQFESSTSITTLSVRAYDAQDARRFNAGLLDQAEKLVNKLNERSRHDLLDVAQKEVDRARKQAIDAAQALAAYRDQAGVVDPEKQAEVQIQMVSKLQDQLIAARIQLDQMKVLAPASSEIAPLESRIAGLEQSIQSEMQRAAGAEVTLACGGGISKAAIR
jgi:capsular polysaccharide transport system permease protein